MWYDSKKEDGHAIAWNTVKAIEDDQHYIYENIRRFATLYRDQGIVGFRPGEFRNDINDLEPPVSYNVIKSCVDALTSKITLHTPMPTYLTSGGKEEIQEKAKKKEKFVLAVMRAEDVKQKAVKAVRDAVLYGIGCLKIYPYQNEVNVDVVHPSRIVIDNDACLDSEPTTIWEKHYISKTKLTEMFPKKKAEINGEEVITTNLYGNLARDLIEIVEVWMKGKRHMIFSSTHTYLDEDFDGNFPFAFIKYNDDVMGWYGLGLGHELEGIQIEINEVLQKISANMDLLAVPYVVKEKSAEIKDEHLLTNKMARMVEYIGTPPQVITPPAAHPQVFSYLETLYTRAFEIAGISQLSATSQKPGGLNSGVALRTFHDIETQRFSIIASRFEKLYIDVAKRITECAKLLSEKEGFKVKAVQKEMFEMIDWKDCEIDEDDYILEVQPSSSLPKTPAGRLQDVIELLQGGMIDPVEGRQLLGFPDLEKSTSLATASRDLLEKVFEKMLYKGVYEGPIEYMTPNILQMGMELGINYYMRGRVDDIAESRLNLILQWLDEARDLLMPLEPTMPAPMPVEPQEQVQPIPIPMGPQEPLGVI